MAILLSRLGRFAYRRAIPVLIAWLLIAAGTVAVGVGLGGTMQDSFKIPGTESQQAIDRLAAVFPQAAGASAQMVVHSTDERVDSDAMTSEIEDVVDALTDVDGVEQAVSPFSEYATDAVSDDGMTAIVQLQFTGASEEVTTETLDEVQKVGREIESDTVQVEFGGQVFQHVTFGITIIEVLGVLFAAVVLLVTFGSLVAAGLPLLSALIALGISMGGVLALSAFTTLSTATPMLALMIGLAVGIDYALFILSRHRTQLANGADPEDSAATSVATAGGSVVFAAVTVMIALLGLLIVGIPFLGLMGVTAAFAVLLAMLAALTLLPAFMGLLGRRLAPRPGSRAARRVADDSAAHGTSSHDAASQQPGSESTPTEPRRRPTLGERWVGLVLKAPIVFILGVVALLGVAAVPATQLALALPDGGSLSEEETSRRAYDLIADAFGPGRNGPLVVMVDITQTTDVLDDLDAIADQLSDIDGVESVGTPTPNATVDTAIIQVIPETGPADPETTALVQHIRDLGPSIEAKYGTAIAVTGSTAVAIDVSSQLNNALIPFGIVVVGLSIVLLMMVFRSIVVPIKAALGYLLSVLASFGIVVAVFQWGWGAELFNAVPGPILSFMPILLMAILFGLAMDYEVFLVSGMREAHVHGATARQAITRGFSGAARVVTAAALIMFFVFAAFVPEGAAMIKVIALGLAVGVAIDAFLVRMTLVPAVMALFGDRAWYLPRWLDRLLPNVDVEGEGLRAHLDDLAWARSRVEAGDAITLQGLVGGADGIQVGPYDGSIPVGAIALVGGDPARRRLLAATVAGRLPAVAGRAQVAGRPLPSETAEVAGAVSFAEFGDAVREADVPLGDLLTERLRYTGHWYRVFSADRRARAWLARIHDAVAASGSAVPIGWGTTLASLPPVERAIATVAVALSERTPVVVVDSVAPLPGSDGGATFLIAIDRLAPATTTVVVGVGDAEHVAAPVLSRPVTRHLPAAFLEGVSR
ncbi:MMPL family transporter [Homoserinibacter sp. GY 40078]|uniref:MMPL family transporter n=1 Tax=Homoserinibacter sp. GY 40078 TaxID=2603275 RepID=UPI0011CB15C0|nr:MMPL family transporter [Homoserinibacter sp. GY 40078]TXK16317.1 MMPL family transporter [Homoserinibacter sp. GY 40078]